MTINGLTSTLKELVLLAQLAHTKPLKWQGSAINGRYLSQSKGLGMAFSDIRTYQPGDDIKHMQWRVTARTGRAHVKVYQEERERPVILVIDFSASMYFGSKIAYKSVVAARLAATIAGYLSKQGDKVGALLHGFEDHRDILPQAHQLSLLPLLSALSDYTQKIDRAMIETLQILPLHQSLVKMHRMLTPGSLVIVISDFYQLTESCLQQLKCISTNNDIIAYHVADSLELAPPKSGQYAFTNGKQSQLFDLNNLSVRDSYQQWCNEQKILIENALTRLAIAYHLVTASTVLPALICQTLPGRPHG